MKTTGKGLCPTSLRIWSCRSTGGAGIPEHGNNGKSCVECDRKTDEAWAQELEPSGGNHLAKILAKKCSGKLYEVTERLRRPIFEEEKVEELYGEILMSAKAPKKDGKGYQYPAIGHVVGLDGKIQGERKRLLHMAGY